jgi:hypothetical protein
MAPARGAHFGHFGIACGDGDPRNFLADPPRRPVAVSQLLVIFLALYVPRRGLRAQLNNV